MGLSEDEEPGSDGGETARADDKSDEEIEEEKPSVETKLKFQALVRRAAKVKECEGSVGGDA